MASRPGEERCIGVTGGRPRIVHVITDGYLMGGAQLNTFYSLRYQKQRYYVELVLGTEGPLGEACRAEGIPVVHVPMKNSLVSPLRDMSSVFELTRHLRRIAPDLVHTHSSKAGVLGRVAARLAGVPVVVHTVHGPPFHDRQPAPVRRLIQRIERYLAARTDRIITVADAIGEDFVRRGICPPQRLRTVVSGIDEEKLLTVTPNARTLIRRELGIPDTAVVVTGVGRLSKNKNYSMLVDVAAEVLRHRTDVYFLVVGDGEERDALTRKIVQTGLSKHVVLCGLRRDVGDVLAASDVFVQTSWSEGVSRSLVEAMYAGLPIVATNVVGTREVVLEGENGFLVPPGDAQAMSARVSALVSDGEQRRELGRAGQQMVSGKRSIEAMGEALDVLYHELLEQSVSWSGRALPSPVEGTTEC